MSPGFKRTAEIKNRPNWPGIRLERCSLQNHTIAKSPNHKIVDGGHSGDIVLDGLIEADTVGVGSQVSLGGCRQWVPSFHRSDCSVRSTGIRVNRRSTDARAFVAQVLRTMERQADRLSAIDARCGAIMNHAHRDFAQNVICRLRPCRLKQTEDWDAMTRG
jgi:hypothetical protein